MLISFAVDRRSVYIRDDDGSYHPELDPVVSGTNIRQVRYVESRLKTYTYINVHMHAE